ncbi:MAG: hypothetical protein WC634_03045 [archaeon]
MPKRFLIAFALLLFLSQALAISAQDAINFATQQNNFLYSGETTEIYPNVRIADKAKDYWVITVLSGDTLSGFIPVYDKTAALPDSAISKRNLIKTAYVLRYEKQINETSSKQSLWLFDAANAKFFSDLAQDLKNEKVDLTTIKTSLAGYSDLQDDTDSLSGQLDEMKPLAEQAGQDIAEAMAFEAEFSSKPDTNSLNAFQKKFQNAFDAIAELETARARYLAELDSLRQQIALINLPLETKQGLNSLANIPSSLQQFSSKATTSIDLEEKIKQVFNGASANVDGLVLGLSTREKRNNAMQALYGMDEEILDKTGEGSLDQLMALLSDEAYVYAWKNQADLANAKADWEKAKAFYEAGSFEQAEQNAASAKKYALNVYAEGIKESEPVVQTDLLFTGVVLLIIAVIIIYALKNRKKFSGLVSGSEEEVEVHGWNE